MHFSRITAVFSMMAVATPWATPEVRAEAAVALAGSVDSPIPSIKIDPAAAGMSRVTFKFKAPMGAKSVNLAGSMNGWNKDADPMQIVGNDYEVAKELKDDEYQYKFVVNGDQWVQDPLNPEGVEDNNGGKNSLLRLGAGAKFRRSEESVGDGKLNADGFEHDPAQVDYVNPQGDGGAIVKVRVAAHDAGSARLVTSAGRRVSLASEFADDRYEFFRGELTASDGNAGMFKYKVVVEDKVATAPASAGATDEREYVATINKTKVFSTPAWARDVVWYQIFPERFRNGDKSNDPTDNKHFRPKWTGDWFEAGHNETGPALELGIYDRMYGGDLQGVTEKLDYLKSLGIGAIYFNPVFQASTNHKYNAMDFRHVDEHFGTKGDWAKANAKEDLLDPKTWTFTDSDKLMLALIKKAHGMGIKVIFDGVWNHTGPEHPAFQDIIKNGKASKYSGWYNVTDWNKPWADAKTPFTYEGWFGVTGLPVFKEKPGGGFAERAVTDHVFAVTRRWMDPNGDGDPSDGIDGWRLDVANEVGDSFWTEWRGVVKGTNPEAVLIAEIWDPPARWVKGDMFDCVMNYESCAKPLLRYWADGKAPSALKADAMRYRHSLPDQSQAVMMNLMDSHDTDRLASMIANPNRSYDGANRLQDAVHANKTFSYDMTRPNAEIFGRVKALAAMQFCWVGSPQIYYGDEVGMWAADDPQNRKPMVWKDLEPYAKDNGKDEPKVDEDLFRAFQRLGAIRNGNPALKRGGFEVLAADDASGVFAFRRWKEGRQVVVVSNNAKAGGSAAKVSLNLAGGGAGAVPESFRDVFGDAAYEVATGADGGPKLVPSKAKRAAVEYKPAAGVLSLSVEPATTMILDSAAPKLP